MKDSVYHPRVGRKEAICQALTCSNQNKESNLRSPCLVYSLTICDDSRAVNIGERYVREMGMREYAIPMSNVKKLVDEFKKSDYFSLRDIYPPAATDIAGCIRSISIGGRTKQVENWQPSAAPKELEALEDKIDELAGSDRYIKLEYPASWLIRPY